MTKGGPPQRIVEAGSARRGPTRSRESRRSSSTAISAALDLCGTGLSDAVMRAVCVAGADIDALPATQRALSRDRRGPRHRHASLRIYFNEDSTQALPAWAPDVLGKGSEGDRASEGPTDSRPESEGSASMPDCLKGTLTLRVRQGSRPSTIPVTRALTCCSASFGRP